MKRSTLLITLFLLAISGLLLHYRVHPFLVPDKTNPGHLLFNTTTFFASLFTLVDVVVVTLLFMFRRTFVYGFLLNGIIVIYGTIFMAHFSISDIIAKSLPISSWITKTTLPDIGIAWADFLVGKTLYEFYLKQGR
jgi:hypothetical protein